MFKVRTVERKLRREVNSVMLAVAAQWRQVKPHIVAIIEGLVLIETEWIIWAIH